MPNFFNTCDINEMPPGVITEFEVETGYLPMQPRIHRETAAPLPLTTSWQRLDLSTLNSNTFPQVGSPKLVDWSPTPKLFTFNDTTTRNYIAALNMKITTTGILITPVVAPVNIQYRFVVPDGVSPGVDYYFPFSTTDGYMDLFQVAWNGNQLVQRLTPVTSDLPKRNTGVGCEAKLSSNPLTGGITVSTFSLYMFGA